MAAKWRRRQSTYGQFRRTYGIGRLMPCCIRGGDSTLIPAKRLPCDVSAERPISPQSRGERIRLELFVRGVKQWGKDTKRLVMAA